MRLQAHAPVFAALGDKTRLSLVERLADGQAYSIAQIAKGSKLTRQAITKHVRVLEKAGLVRCGRMGRESRIALNPQSIVEVRNYLDQVSAQWDQTLSRLKALVETGIPG